MDGAYRDTDN
jgi:hypothetical protein